MGGILSSLCLVTQARDFPSYDVRHSMQLQREGYHRTNPGSSEQALINMLLCPVMVMFTTGTVKIILKCFRGKNQDWKSTIQKIIVLYQGNKDITDQLSWEINKLRKNVIEVWHLNKLLLSQPNLDISLICWHFESFLWITRTWPVYESSLSLHVLSLALALVLAQCNPHCWHQPCRTRTSQRWALCFSLIIVWTYSSVFYKLKANLWMSNYLYVTF